MHGNKQVPYTSKQQTHCIPDDQYTPCSVSKSSWTSQTTTHLFHAISPMARTNRFSIQYLPQHCFFLVQDILAQILETLPGFQVNQQNLPPPPTKGQPTMSGGSSQQLYLGTQPSLVTTTVPIPDSMAYITKEQSSTPKAAVNPNPNCNPTASSLQDKTTQFFQLRYTEKVGPSHTESGNYYLNTSACHILLSSSKSWQWIKAILTQFFNMAWNWWGYWLGIQTGQLEPIGALELLQGLHTCDPISH